MDIKFSKSRYELQSSCLGKYYYAYINKTPVQETLWPGTLFGTSAHLYIEENLHKIEKEKDIKKLPKLSDYYLTEKEKIPKTVTLKKPRGFEEETFLTEIDKWSKDMMRFMFLYLPSGERIFEQEIREEILIGEDKISILGYIDLQIKTEEANHIFDFKTTKSSQKYYFVHWDRDPQSLCYLYSKKGDSFAYLVIDKENRLIISTSRPGWNQNDEAAWENLLKKFISRHKLAGVANNWVPEEEACKWCDYKKICVSPNRKT